MNPSTDPIQQLQASLDQHIQATMNAAWSSPPGGGHAWNRFLTHYGVAPVSPVDRVKTAANLRQTRGAIPAEVKQVLQAIACWAHGQLQAIARDPRMLSDPRFNPLGARITGLVHNEGQRYESWVTPKPEPSVGSIFSNASSTAGLFADVKIVDSNVLVCDHCGAPQERAMDFRCKYCGQPMGGPSPS